MYVWVGHCFWPDLSRKLGHWRKERKKERKEREWDHLLQLQFIIITTTTTTTIIIIIIIIITPSCC
jgi:hypothetical protein